MTARESLADAPSPKRRQHGAGQEGVTSIVNFERGSQHGGIEEFASESRAEPDDQRPLFKFSPSHPSMIGHRFA